jgi:hypothetical protein
MAETTGKSTRSQQDDKSGECVIEWVRYCMCLFFGVRQESLQAYHMIEWVRYCMCLFF